MTTTIRSGTYGKDALKSVNVGALPVPMRQLGLVKSGPYLHSAKDKVIVEFEADDLPRSFTIILAVAHIGRDMRLDRNGIAVIDNDNWCVVADEIERQGTGIRGASRAQREAFTQIAGLNWAEFTHLLRNEPTYRSGKAADIEIQAGRPDTGNFDRQSHLGLRGPEERDLRDEFLKLIDATGDYKIPFVNRRTAINEILLHATTPTRGGRCLSWNVSMDGFDWDRSGVISDGNELHHAYNDAWNDELVARPELIEQAVEAFLTPYVKDSFNALEQDGARSALDLAGDQFDAVVLREFNGRGMEFSSHRDLRKTLDAMDDLELCKIWSTMRVLDSDLSRSERAMGVGRELNEIRAGREDVWLRGDLEEEIDFMALAS